ncbi:MAG: hypothetical protein CM1200mP14_27310 [Gammaproteobacteria bacterium]|nr:MAG: hypothetical protein CM1200mP14_27310 [Gammaproteobacteria bacterium]
MIYFAFAGAAYNVDERQQCCRGTRSISLLLWPYLHLTYEGLSVSLGRGQRNLLWQAIATVSVEQDGVAKGILTTEKRQYVTSDQLMTEVGIRSTVREDLYLILSAMDDVGGALSANSSAQGIDLQVLVKPFVLWIWAGGLILALGTVIALWPSVDRRRRRNRPELEAVTTGAPRLREQRGNPLTGPVLPNSL